MPESSRTRFPFLHVSRRNAADLTFPEKDPQRQLQMRSDMVLFADGARCGAEADHSNNSKKILPEMIFGPVDQSIIRSSVISPCPRITHNRNHTGINEAKSARERECHLSTRQHIPRLCSQWTAQCPLPTDFDV